MSVNNWPIDDNLTSVSLIARLRQPDDDDAWLRFSYVYGPLISRWCERSGLQHADVADVMQEVMASARRGIAKVNHGGENDSFRGWLWAITRQRVRDHFRSFARQPIGYGGSTALQLIENLPDDAPETSEDVADLHLRVLAGLHADFSKTVWTSFWRVVVEKDAAKNVAEDLGVSVWAVYKAKSRVLTRLRQELGGTDCPIFDD